LHVVNSSWDHLKILSDSTRLRLLALLLREELSVAELQEILGMAQSRISSQLALLRQAGFVSDRREGKKAFYSLRATLDPKQLTLLRAACDAVTDLPESGEDRDSLDRVLQKRRRVSEQYFNLIAGKLGKNYCPGRSWEAIGHLALRLVPAITVADLGAGEGLISQLIAHRAERVWCIDNSERMVEVGTELARKNGLVLILDLNEHSYEKAHEQFGDLWLGFKESALHGFLKKAGFTKAEVQLVSRETVEPHFETLLASGIKGGR
jgi:ArsR family transcriptional regulator